MLSPSIASAAVLSLAGLVLACPSPAQLGDISILAENDLISKSILIVTHHVVVRISWPGQKLL